MNLRKATLFMLLSAFSFSIMQLFVKMTAGNYGTFQQVFLRNIIILFFSGIIIKKRGVSFKIEKSKLALLLRSLFGFLGVFLFFYSIKSLNLADASALQKSSPFFVTLFSFLILKEEITKSDIFIIILAFIGVLLVIKPNFQLLPIPSMAALFSAIFAGMAYVLISYIGDDIDSQLIIFYFSLFSTIVSIPLMMSTFKVPESQDIIPLILIGVGGGFGQLFLTMGYKLAPPGKVSVYNFTNIIFSALLGYLIYRETIDLLSLIGIVTILIAALLAHYKNNRKWKGESR